MYTYESIEGPCTATTTIVSLSYASSPTIHSHARTTLE